MSSLRRHRLGACLTLALLILSGILPAFASPGLWVCPNGHACPWMNGGPSYRMSQDAKRVCAQAGPRSCCRCPARSQPRNRLSATPECRFVPSFGRPQIGLALAPQTHPDPAPSPAVPPLSLECSLSARRKIISEVPLPSNFSLPPSPISSATPSRAPPLG
jgi:hypothetical protein